jgi:hypothetical protein
MPITSPPPLKASMFGRMPVGGGQQKTGGGAPAPTGPKGVRVEHRIGVQAPAEVIWDIVYDIDNWSAWNPLYPEASGIIRIGQTLEMTVALPDMKPQKARATVLEWVPNEQLHYQTVALGGLVRGTRYVEIEELAPGSCIVANGEIMGGFVGRRLARAVGGKVFKGLRAMNEALKARAEARASLP